MSQEILRDVVVVGASIAGVSAAEALRRDDAAALRSAMRPGRRLVVVGGGLIGCEVAATARARELDVTMVESESVLLGRVLGSEVGEVLAGVHRDRGVRVRTGALVKSVGVSEAGLSVTIDVGRTLHADLVVVGLGAVPNVEWLRGSGLELSDGVRCDADGRTSAPHVFAAGDVAAWPDAARGRHVRGQHWTRAREQGAVVAAAALGLAVPPASTPYFWSDQYDLRVQCYGDSTGVDHTTFVWGGLAGPPLRRVPVPCPATECSRRRQCRPRAAPTPGPPACNGGRKRDDGVVNEPTSNGRPHVACCAPRARSDERDVSSGPATGGSPHRNPRNRRGQVPVPGGTFWMGDAYAEGYPSDGETPVHEVTLPSFHLDATTVSNAQFATFVKSTGHRTDAEELGVSAVFHAAFDGNPGDVVRRVEEAPWWLAVRGASWRHPEGPGSHINDRQNHPVVHVSWRDAQAYCAWSGKRLPTEAEWEYAARGGVQSARYAWGDELLPNGRWRCNIWQGDFPRRNTGDDGYLTTAPVKTYAPNGHGLWQMAGNVWEWCGDWFDPTYYARSPRSSPTGPEHGELRVMRGGSYLCHDSYCNRYRVAARTGNTPESAASNIGFRCANDG